MSLTGYDGKNIAFSLHEFRRTSVQTASSCKRLWKVRQVYSDGQHGTDNEDVTSRMRHTACNRKTSWGTMQRTMAKSSSSGRSTNMEMHSISACVRGGGIISGSISHGMGPIEVLILFLINVGAPLERSYTSGPHKHKCASLKGANMLPRSINVQICGTNDETSAHTQEVCTDQRHEIAMGNVSEGSRAVKANGKNRRRREQAREVWRLRKAGASHAKAHTQSLRRGNAGSGRGTRVLWNRDARTGSKKRH